ncbi:GNAT family N-acetyltransferase [Candidatus Bathycorpusculum sp.]|uniref:GNAT family N-acetyltransferase n=1 Tax=Candidatus Bathycorpusculum sp. TaxID=2994959 RepID=UPI002823F535|nr:GNAT family N-acetyltransferase [Candidatus Termitimicrobium sp.]MCL2685855.1 GNAT family N-acetyltransferase [Candidatus Termitimicrobium sp.]
MVQILKAQLEDLNTILQLQYLAYQSEALLHNNFTIHPLTQTFDELIKEYHTGIILKAVENNEIIGSIRAHADDTTVYIAKLMVHPTHQGKGIGKRLLTEIENTLQRKRYELFTSYKSQRNLHIYKTAGYTQFREETNLGIKFLYLEKQTR